MTWTWVAEPEAGRWIADAVHPFAQDIGSVIPDHFEAYARIFHPLYDAPHRWRDLAALNDRVVHPEMQWHRIAQSRDAKARHVDPHRIDAPIGTMDRDELIALVDLVRPHTSTSCWFAVWEGYGQLHGETMTPALELPARRYCIATGDLADAVAIHDHLGNQSPNLWWPDDRSWCVATEIDFAWTYVGGTRAVVDGVLASPALEALEARPEHRFTVDSDRRNG